MAWEGEVGVAPVTKSVSVNEKGPMERGQESQPRESKA